MCVCVCCAWAGGGKPYVKAWLNMENTLFHSETDMLWVLLTCVYCTNICSTYVLCYVYTQPETYLQYLSLIYTVPNLLCVPCVSAPICHPYIYLGFLVFGFPDNRLFPAIMLCLRDVCVFVCVCVLFFFLLIIISINIIIISIIVYLPDSHPNTFCILNECYYGVLIVVDMSSADMVVV